MMNGICVSQGGMCLSRILSCLGIMLAVVGLAVPTSGQAAVVAYKGIAYAEPPVGLTGAPPKLAGMPHGADSALFWGQLDPIPGMQELGAQLRRAWSDFAKGATVLAGDRQPWTTPSGYWQSVMDAQGSVQAALAPRLTVVAEAYARRYPTSLEADANLNINE